MAWILPSPVPRYGIQTFVWAPVDYLYIIHSSVLVSKWYELPMTSTHSFLFLLLLQKREGSKVRTMERFLLQPLDYGASP